MTRFTAAVYGASGYLGGEVVRRLLQHPQVSLIQVCADDHLGQPLSAAHPNLEAQSALRFEAIDPTQPVSADVLFMALPHEVSWRVMERLRGSSVRVIDMSGAFRVSDASQYQRYYGKTHPLPELLPSFIYGLPELNRARITGSQYVASPGCFATAIELGLLPLARQGLLSGAVQVVALTGSSGSGKQPNATTHHPARSQNVRSYRPLSHTQSPEIAELLTAARGAPVEVQFVPISGPFVRGIFATSFAHLSGMTGRDAEDEALVGEAFRVWLGAERFVRRPVQRLPELAAVVRSNFVEVGFQLGPMTPEGLRLVTCFSALDNLVKGGGGQAVQNMNLMLGLAEDTALADPGSYP